MSQIDSERHFAPDSMARMFENSSESLKDNISCIFSISRIRICINIRIYNNLYIYTHLRISINKGVMKMLETKLAPLVLADHVSVETKVVMHNNRGGQNEAIQF